MIFEVENSVNEIAWISLRLSLSDYAGYFSLVVRRQNDMIDWKMAVSITSRTCVLKKVESGERSRKIDPVISTRRRRIVFPLRTRRDNVSVKL